MGCDVPSISFAELPGNPVPPSSGRLKLFVLASNHEFYVINSAGSVSLLSSYVLGPALQSIEALEPIPADKFLYTNAENTFNESPITLLARQLLAEATQGGMVAVIGAQPLSADLTAFVTNATWTGANLTLAGGLTVDSSLSVLGDIAADSNVTITLDLTVGNIATLSTLICTGPAQLNSGIGVTGSSQFDDAVNIDDNLTIDGTIVSTGAITGPSFIVSAGGPTITTGSAVPAAAAPDGSIYLRSGAPNGSLYVRQNGVWTLK